MEQVFFGIDVGTQGVRGVAVTADGTVLCRHSVPFQEIDTATRPGRHQQRSGDWWAAVVQVARALAGADGEPAALALDGTSGTILPLDRENRPLGESIMYNDARSAPQAERLDRDLGARRFNASFGLPKMLWCLEQGMEAARFVHQADYLLGRLTGQWGVTDCANAMKSGYDLEALRWPDWMGDYLDPALLPQVLPCGTAAGRLTREAAECTGLPEGLTVCVGATDGYASALAAGLARPGQWASVIGTTLVLKGITERQIVDPDGTIYCHRHPEGWWMPGGASNGGGGCLRPFGAERFDALNAQVPGLTPTGDLYYPSLGVGERFPFCDPAFPGFSHATAPKTEARRYTAALEGVGYLERMCYERLAALGYETGDTVLTAGGACRSRAWLQIRADILGRVLKVPETVDAAMGSAMLAAGETAFGRLSTAVEAMVRFAAVVEPRAEMTARYESHYQAFAAQVERVRGGGGL